MLIPCARVSCSLAMALLLSAATGQGVKEALHALVEVIGEAPVSSKARGTAEMEPWTA